MLLRASALILAATLVAPVVASAGPQVHVGVTIGRDHRVYDRRHRDYHVWGSQESANYRHYLAERHVRYVPYARQRRARQSAYWQWRHARLERR